MYENLLEKFCAFMDPLLDSSPPEKLQDISPFNTRMKDNLQKSIFWAHLLRRAAGMGQKDLLDFVDLLLSPASKVLNNWFEVSIQVCSCSIFSWGRVKCPHLNRQTSKTDVNQEEVTVT
ncbi:hypothetical protein OROGR_008035 [Orobanche gracilis]